MNTSNCTRNNTRIAPLEMLQNLNLLIGADSLNKLDEIILSRAAFGLPQPDQPVLTLSDVQRVLPKQSHFVWYLAFFSATWRRYKQILDTDPTLIDLLNMTDLDEIPADPFRCLPYPCFYVRFPKQTWKLDADNGCNNLDGCFVANDTYIDSDGVSHPAIRFLVICDGGDRVFPYDYLYNAGNIRESTRQKRKCGFYYNNRYDSRGNPFSDSFSNCYESDASVLPHFLKLVLYIISQGADVEVRQPAAVDPSPLRGTPLKDKYREISFWNVGVRTGAKWRASLAAHSAALASSLPLSAPPSKEKGSEEGSRRAPVRPHIRRGHYHHYWTGPRKEPGERKLIVKWLPPTFVTATPSDALPVTVRVV